MVEGSGFENRRRCKSTEGSNPFSSAKFDPEWKEAAKWTDSTEGHVRALGPTRVSASESFLLRQFDWNCTKYSDSHVRALGPTRVSASESYLLR